MSLDLGTTSSWQGDHRPPWQRGVGWLCRHLVLAAGAGLLMLSAATAMVATTRLAADLDAAIALPDAATGLHRPQTRIWGYASLSLRSSASALPATRAILGGDGVVALTWQAGDGRVTALVGELVAPGAHPVELQGMPYGPLSLQRRRALLVGVGHDRPLVMLDAGLVGRTGDGRGGGFEEFMDALREGGQLLVFHAGPLEDHVEFRRRLHRRDPRWPVAYVHDRRGDGLAVLRVVQREVDDRVIVVTDDVDVLNAVRDARRFKVYFVGGQPPPEPLRGAITHVASPEALLEFLPAIIAGRRD